MSGAPLRSFIIILIAALTSMAGGSADADASPDCSAFNSAAFFASATPEDVAHCLEQGAPLMPEGLPEDRPLFHAVRYATSPLVIDVLLDAANEREQLDHVLDHPGNRGRSIMHVAAADARDPAMITWLAGWGVSVLAEYDCNDAWIFKDCTMPIHLAASRPDGFLFVATLLALGADRTMWDRDGRTPLELAIDNEADRWNIRALLGAPDWPSENAGIHNLRADRDAPCDTFLTPGFFASATLAQLVYCLNHGGAATSTDRDGNTALHHAAAHATDPRVIDLLLRPLHRRNPEAIANALRRTNNARLPPLHHAARHGVSAEVIARLLTWGDDPNALAEPIERRRLGADRGTTPLHMAVRNTGPARRAILTVLMAAGASTTVQDHGTEGHGGRQALHYLMRHAPDVREVSLLLEAEFAQKPLGTIIIDEFVRRRVTVVSDDAGNTALHVAAQSDADHSVMVELLWYGFEPDTANRDGITPLMLAAGHVSDPEGFLLLLEGSSNPCRESRAGLTIPALLAENETLNREDPTGAELTPLEAYRDRCP